MHVRPLTPGDNTATAAVIRRVLTEYGLNREGFAFVDIELEALSDAYAAPAAAYFVAEADGKIFGGAGFGPLLGGDGRTAELKKMYLLPEARGLGVGRLLMENILPQVKTAGYEQLYLETMPFMQDAIRLYEKYGFRALPGRLGNTGHFGCESFYLRSMASA